MMRHPVLMHRGSHSLVFRVEDQRGRRYALRVVRPREAMSQDGVLAWRSAQQRRVLRPGQSWGEQPLLWDASPWIEGWSLAEIQAGLRAQRRLMPAAEALEIASALALELDLLHARGVIHARLQAERVLVDAAGRVHLLGRPLRIARPRVSQSPLELARCAPEELEGGPVDAPADVYRLALLVLELLSGGEVLKARTVEATRARVLDGFRRLSVPGLDAAQTLWLEACLAADPSWRPTCRLRPVWKHLHTTAGPGLGLRELVSVVMGEPSERPPLGVRSPEERAVREMVEQLPLLVGASRPLGPRSAAYPPMS